MKRFFLVCGLVILFSGCASSELARIPYGETEIRWMNYLEECYPNWIPPATPPPLLTELDYSEPQIDMPIRSAIPINNTISIMPGASRETYIVRKNDTLWSIAQFYYKDGNQWTRIYNENESILTTPNSLKPGLEIIIPLH